MSTTTQAKPAQHNKPHDISAKAETEVKVAAPAAVPVATIDIGGLSVSLPIKFSPGHILTENQAKILDSAYQRQFTNNQAANAKARAERFKAAKTDSDRAANAPLTAAQLADIYATYEPAVGDTVRTDMLTRLRQEAAWRLWVSMVTAHNDDVRSGGKSPVFSKAAGKIVPLPERAIKVNEGGKEVVISLADQRNTLANDLLARPSYADRIQVMLDAILAERGKKADVVAAEEKASGNVADLL
jgi:hypothetical protein